MVIGYYIAYSSLGILIAAFIPAMIAAGKERRFSKWYIYSALLLPVAFIHSLLLKKPVHYINVYTHDKKNPLKRKRVTYRAVPAEKKHIVVSPTYIYLVFFSKLIFGAFAGVVLFAIFRTFVFDTKSLRAGCAIFALLFSILLSAIELSRYSRFPMIADEITKRSLIMLGMSIVCSLPLFLLQTFVFANTLPEKHATLTMFACTTLSFLLFVVFLTKKQRIYYSVFNRFSDYCLISMASYAIFAAISLIWLSISNLDDLIYVIAMPMQIFNLDYFSELGYMNNISYMYSSAFAHLFFELIILFSGLLCRRFKRKEFEYRVEYRSKAFRMSRKPILRRHIPRPAEIVPTKPLHSA